MQQEGNKYFRLHFKIFIMIILICDMNGEKIK
jgi:hypothetical protein